MFTIYALHDPTGFSHAVYIGATNNAKKRMENHISHSAMVGTSHRAQWIRSLSAAGISPEMAVLEVTKDGPEAERFWIAAMRLNGVLLLNMADGGPGCIGTRHSPDVRGKISRALTGREISQETRDRVGSAHRGRKESTAARKNVSTARRGQVISTRNTTGFRGVNFSQGAFRAMIHINGKYTHIGRYKTAEEAARAYDGAARAAWGSDAALNFPNDGERAARR